MLSQKRFNQEHQTQDIKFTVDTSTIKKNLTISEIDDRWMELKILQKNVPPRSYHIATIYKDCLYIQGGYDVQNGILSDFQKLELTGMNSGFIWKELNQNDKNYPGKLKSHSGVVHEDKLIIFGGQMHSNQNSNITYIYCFETDKWQKIFPDIDIPKLDSHSACIYQNKMYIFGGFSNEDALYYNKFYQFDLSSKKWKLYYQPKKIEQSPCGRGNLSLVQFKGQVWIFGGINEVNTLNDMWKFNLTKKYWQKIIIVKDIIPEPRRSHSMIVYENDFYMFGGIQDVTKQKNDIYLFSTEENRWILVQNSSNLIYQCSPTYQKQKLEKKIRINENSKHNHNHEHQNNHKLIKKLSNTHSYKSQKDFLHPIIAHEHKNFIDENKHKKFLEKKYQMLKDFNDNSLTDSKVRIRLSPTSENMLKTLKIIGDQQQSKKFHQKVLLDPSKKYILGKKPCARDAHIALLYHNKMLIMGGDRHLMSFSDIYYFDLIKVVSLGNR